MKQKREILDKILNQPTSAQVWVGQVTAVNGLTCTVSLLATELTVQDVRLVADGDAVSYMIVKPKVGSTVLVGLVENQITDLYVAQASDFDEIIFKNGDVSVSIKGAYVEVKNDKSTVVVEDSRVWLRHDQTSIQLAQKVEVKNAGASLLDLFADLITLLNSFGVLTPAGPSTGLNPATTALLIQLQTKVNLLLQ